MLRVAICRYFGSVFKIRQYGSGKLRRIHSLVWVAGYLPIFVTTSYVQRLDCVFFDLLHLGLRFLLSTVGSLTAFVTLQQLADHIQWRKSKVFFRLSKCAMPVYLIHQQVIYLSIHWLNGKVNPYIYATISFVVLWRFRS